LGASGGAGGDGGTVNVTSQGSLFTIGADSYALVAQSIGGGGGTVIGLGPGGAPLALQLQAGSGGSGGNGGAVTVSSSGGIFTSGAGAGAIVAQSVGGGGGLIAGGTDAFAGSVGGRGAAGPVTVTQSGVVSTQGDQADSILAQSAGGEGSGGAVSVTVSGVVSATGQGANGIVAQSSGDAGAGDISIDVASGIVQGGSGPLASGVRLEDGAHNSLVNDGSISTTAGIAGVAIRATGGNNAIDNFGSVTGSVDLGAGVNSFHNEAGASFDSGAVAILGSGNLLTNDGLLSPGGRGNIMTTAITGNLAQTGRGSYVLDLDYATGAADRLEVSGSSTLAGTVAVSTMNPGFIKPGDHRPIIVSSAGGLTLAGLTLDAAQTAVVQSELLLLDPTDLALDYDVNFAPAGLNANRTAIGEYLNTVQTAGGSSSLAPVVAQLVALPDVPALAAAYDHLSPEVYVGNETGAFFSNLHFNDMLQSCRVARGELGFAREEGCAWLTLGGETLRQDQTTANFGFYRNAFDVDAGVRLQVSDEWIVGLGAGYETSWLHAADISTSYGTQVQAGIVVKWEHGDSILSALVSGGHANFNSSRQVGLPVAQATATSEPELNFVSGRLRLSHTLTQRGWYLEPLIDAGPTYIHMPSFAEHGIPGAMLDVDSSSSMLWSAQPALEIGGDSTLRDGSVLRAVGRAGLLHFFTGTSPVVAASIDGAPAGTGEFAVNGHIDRNFGTISLELELLTRHAVQLKLDYDGQFSPHAQAYSSGGSLRAEFRF
jgi:hypothetical protein